MSDSLAQVAPLAELIDQLKPRLGAPAQSRAQWYALHLVAASPMVVVGVPVSSRSDVRCVAEVHCAALRVNAAWQLSLLIGAAPTTEGAFVYATSDPARTLSFPAPNTTVERPLEGGAVQVSHAGGIWRVAHKS